MDTSLPARSVKTDPSTIRWTFVVVAAALGVVVGLSGSSQYPFLILLPVAMGFLLFVYARPEVGLVFLLFLSLDVLFVNQAVDIRAFGGGFELRDTFLIVMWGVALLRYPRRWLKLVTSDRVAVLMVIFLAGAAWSAFWAWARFSVDPFPILQELRAVASYSVFFLVAIVLKNKGSFQFLVRFLTLLASVLALISIAQFVAGADFVFTGGRVEVRAQETFGLTRVLLPSAFFVNALLIISVARMAFARRSRERVILALVVGLLATSVALTLSRTLWLADAIVLALLFLMVSRRTKLVLATVLSAGALVPLLLLNPFASSRGGVSLLEGLRERIMQPFERDLLQDRRTLGGRIMEFPLAVEKIKQHPVFGIGLGNRYYDYSDQIWSIRNDPGRQDAMPRFVHNGYLWIALKMGLPMLFLLLFILARVTRMAHSSFRAAQDEYVKGVSAGLLLGLVGLCISALSFPIFMQPSNVVTLSTVMALVVVGRGLFNRGSDFEPGRVGWSGPDVSCSRRSEVYGASLLQH